jgi:hypothetical protein
MAFSVIGTILAVKEHFAMTPPLWKWVSPSCLVAALCVFSIHASAQQNIQTVKNISRIPGLKTNAPIALPRRGAEAPHQRGASPFSGAAPANAASSHNGLRYPGDLQYHGGPVLDTTVQHATFINPSSSCLPNSCYGDPIGFLNDLNRSEFIHLTDAYVGDYSSNRYPDGTNYAVTGYTPSAGAGKPFTDLDLARVAYYLASQSGGFGDLYHLFLPPGQDVCFNSTFSNCYSPDNGNTWFFCAYHSGVQDSAGNVVYYSVEPYQNVSGCNVGPGTPNGPLADSTNNVLSHETIEAITDPQGTGWWNHLDTALYGEEIADECVFLLFTPTDVFWDPSVVRLHRKQYAIQPEYDNAQHACATKPD